jgi:hypothetical protein
LATIGSAENGATSYFVFNLPLGATVVVGGMGREDAAEESFGGLLSFFGFFAILLLRCSPLGMLAPDDELNVTQPKVCGCCLPVASFVPRTLAHPLQ